MAYGDSVLTTDRIPTEHEEQRELVRTFRTAYPGTRIFAIPNGGHRTKLVAAKLKVEGVSAGVPDLFIPAFKLWVEMKRQKGGALSAAQKDWIEYLTICGYRCIVAKGADDAMTQIRAIMKPT